MKVWKQLVVMAALVALAIWWLMSGQFYLKKKQALEVAASSLRDPSSAQFRNVKRSGVYFCGEINGKNAFGAYTGFRKFYATATGSEAMIEPGDDVPQIVRENFEFLLPDACK